MTEDHEHTDHDGSDEEEDDQLPDLVVAGPGDTVVEVYEEEDGWSVWIGDDEVGDHPEWRAAFTDAVAHGDPDPATTVDDAEPIVLAELHASDGLIWIIRVGETAYQAVMELYEDESAHELEGTFPTLEAAVLEVAAGLFGESG